MKNKGGRPRLYKDPTEKRVIYLPPDHVEKINAAKHDGESFSSVVRRLIIRGLGRGR